MDVKGVGTGGNGTEMYTSTPHTTHRSDKSASTLVLRITAWRWPLLRSGTGGRSIAGKRRRRLPAIDQYLPPAPELQQTTGCTSLLLASYRSTAQTDIRPLHTDAYCILSGIGVKKLRFFILVTFLRFLTFFYFPNVFLLKNVKNVGKVQSGKQINKKPFQNNSNEIDHE